MATEVLRYRKIKFSIIPDSALFTDESEDDDRDPRDWVSRFFDIIDTDFDGK